MNWTRGPGGAVGTRRARPTLPWGGRRTTDHEGIGRALRLPAEKPGSPRLFCVWRKARLAPADENKMGT